MAKKKSGGGGGANWMDTYGDMVTLLLCFFVLLYSMSTISEDKWKALVQSFNPNAIPAATEIEGGNDGPNADDAGESGIMDQVSDDVTQQDVEDMMQELFAALKDYAKQDGMDNTVSVSMDGGVIYVTLSDRAMFVPDKADFVLGAEEILTNVCGMLDSAKDAIDEIQIIGHTAQANPNRPNAVKGDRRLASNRATEVTIFLQEHCSIFPGRLLSVGAGQWQPIGDNKSEEGRAPNRRVELRISARDLEQEALKGALSQYTTNNGAQAGAPAGSEDQDQAPAADQNP